VEASCAGLSSSRRPGLFIARDHLFQMVAVWSCLARGFREVRSDVDLWRSERLWPNFVANGTGRCNCRLQIAFQSNGEIHSNFGENLGVPSFGDDIQKEIDGPLCCVAILRLFQSLNKTTIYFVVILRVIIGSGTMS
jgi:hypothetical protein